MTHTDTRAYTRYSAGPGTGGVLVSFDRATGIGSVEWDDGPGRPLIGWDHEFWLSARDGWSFPGLLQACAVGEGLLGALADYLEEVCVEEYADVAEVLRTPGLQPVAGFYPWAFFEEVGPCSRS